MSETTRMEEDVRTAGLEAAEAEEAAELEAAEAEEAAELEAAEAEEAAEPEAAEAEEAAEPEAAEAEEAAELEAAELEAAEAEETVEAEEAAELEAAEAEEAAELEAAEAEEAAEVEEAAELEAAEAEEAAELEAAEAEEAAAAVSSAAAEEAEEQEAKEEELAPEDRARRLFASYLEAPEAEKEESKEAAEEITLADLLDEEELETQAEAGVEGEATGEEEDEEGEPSAEGRNWFVVHSYSGYENKVKKNLEHRIASLGMQHKIFEVVVPTEEEIELKDGQRRKVERRIFPGYILVDMMMDEDSWYVVRNTPGVTGFVGSIRRPTPLRKRDVDKILKRMRAETPRVTVTFRPGQKVRIADGPFEDFVGTVDEIYPDKGKVRILVSFFGRETPVELDFLQVEKIT